MIEAGILLKFCVARYMKLVVGELDKCFMLAHAYMQVEALSMSKCKYVSKAFLSLFYLSHHFLFLSVEK